MPSSAPTPGPSPQPASAPHPETPEEPHTYDDEPDRFPDEPGRFDDESDRFDAEPDQAEIAAARLTAPAPATVAGGNGAGHEPPAAPVGPRPRPAASPYRPPSRPVPDGPGGRRPLPPIGSPPKRSSSAGRRFAMLIGALGVVAAVAVALIATSGGGTSQTSSSVARTTNAPATHPRTTPVFKPASVTVAVLNGTSTNQLAHTVAAKLAAQGYKEGAIATASNQTETTTVVAYLPGSANRNDALHVATALKLRPSAVKPIDQTAQQVACPPPAACNANVVVTVGADLATL
jgi:LytR cell envelope-related transcriptional attenuator